MIQMDFDFGMSAEKATIKVVAREYRPRDYQIAAAQAAFESLELAQATALYLATGTGKTEIAALLVQLWQQAGVLPNILIIAPRRELVRQFAERLRLRGVPCGIEMADERSDQPVTVACYASLASRDRVKRYIGTTGLVIVDECHANYSIASLAMLEDLRECGARVVGMTASPPPRDGVFKQDSGENRELVLSDHYGTPSYIYDYLSAVRDGYLVACRMHLCVIDDLDLSKYRASFGGDFDKTRIDRLMRDRSVVAGVGAMIEKHWDGEPSVVFCGSIKHAEAVRDDLLSRGIESSIVHSKMDADEQRLHLDDFMNGRSKLIINVGILTMGWDAPHVRKLFVARCTASAQLYLQMFGRGPRCLPNVIDGINTVTGRLAAIAASDKPFFEVYDITDSSRHNDLKTAMDVLMPALEGSLMRRLKKRNTRQPIAPEEVDAILAEERAAAIAEQLALDALEMRRRTHIEVRTGIATYERDPMADAEGKGGGKRAVDYWWMPYGRYKGRQFSKIPRGYLTAILPHVKQENLSRNIRRHLSRS